MPIEKKMMECHGTPGRNEVPSDNIETTQFAKRNKMNL